MGSSRTPRRGDHRDRKPPWRSGSRGFIQYLSPVGLFVLAVAVYGESFARDQLVAFGCIWLGLAAFSADLVLAARAAAPLSRTGR